MSDYERQIDELIGETTRLLERATTDEQRRDAVVNYLSRGFAIGATSGELTDFFCVDTPNIVEGAGFVGNDGDSLVAMFDEEHCKLGRR